jgi:ectoine hydroxylase-related dioxygenase (phytanoyl-CoA dioxygenase family)
MSAPMESPTPEDAVFFRDCGFLTLHGLLSQGEVAELAATFDEAVKRATGRFPHAAGISDNGADSLVTVVSPEAFTPMLRDSRLVSEARRIMSVLFRVSEDRLLCGWRCFLKPCGGDVTPWHQDAAYRPPPHHGGTVWLPLDPATFASGCLEYLPGSHRGPVLEHALHGHHLVAEPMGVDRAISCPLSPGDVSIHNSLTVHRAGANRTAKPRRAFAVVCQVVPE